MTDAVTAPVNRRGGEPKSSTLHRSSARLSVLPHSVSVLAAVGLYKMTAADPLRGRSKSQLV